MELKPCPFCSGKAQISRAGVKFLVGCTMCLVVTIAYKNKEEAIEAWNRRAEE